jgi:hypothetical protein
MFAISRSVNRLKFRSRIDRTLIYALCARASLAFSANAATASEAKKQSVEAVT